MEFVLSQKNTNELALYLNELYYYTVIENKISQENEYISIIVSSVKYKNSLTATKFADSNGAAYAFDPSKKLCQYYLQKIDPFMKQVYSLADACNTKFQNIADIMAVITPYILIKFELGTDEILLVVGLAIVLAKIVVENLSEKNNIEGTFSDTEILNICESNIQYLKNIKTDSCNKELETYEKSLSEILDKNKP